MSYQCFLELLKINNTTAYRVSKDTKISAATFTDWKNGRSIPKADKLKKIADYFGVSINYFFSDPSTSPSLLSHRGAHIPIIGVIRAGSPIITEETLLGHEWADVEDADDYFYLEINGDSMKNIGMVHGSLVLFKKQQYAQNGDIVACLVDGDSATIKRFVQQGRAVTLKPENREYSPIKLTTDDFESGMARILGVASEVKIML